MAVLAKRLLTILLCLLLLSHQQKASGLKGVSLFFRQENKPRILAERTVASVHNKGYPAKRASSVDPNRMSDRRVRRGSDPIHNSTR
jgi:hypothetical protein